MWNKATQHPVCMAVQKEVGCRYLSIINGTYVLFLTTIWRLNEAGKKYPVVLFLVFLIHQCRNMTCATKHITKLFLLHRVLNSEIYLKTLLKNRAVLCSVLCPQVLSTGAPLWHDFSYLLEVACPIKTKQITSPCVLPPLCSKEGWDTTDVRMITAA